MIANRKPRQYFVLACALATLAACGAGGDASVGQAGSTATGAASASSGSSATTASGTGTNSGAGTTVAAINARPNDGSGYWPDFSNTGYAHTPANAGGLGLPAYPGHLDDFAPGMTDSQPLFVTYANGSVIAYKHFRGLKILIYGDNLTFVGCLFEGTDPNDNLVQIYSPTNISFRYSTFKPAAYAMPPGNDGHVASAHTPPGTPFNQSWQLATTMDEAVVVMDHNDIWGNAGLEMVTGFPGRPSTWTNNYIHDAADTANNVYHHDGIGPQSDGNGGPMLIDHNTIASLGNTNGLALQGGGVYDHIAFTNNYVSGWGYALAFGTSNNATNLTVTGNVFSAELAELWGPLYGNLWGGQAHGSLWRNNRFQVRRGDDNTSLSPSDQGTYWWPTDNVGHRTDFTG
ncbi:hypothetical protein [Trinickia soli]|uniref:Right handed beta helix domain-containing protein n=1 Tax=Trinickia soli TaxID=380675 RepID=A0A2N7WFM4_9BURK|nr:hypothetical protein [Trinickia soli]PMS28256.1 hypothetical protein C0Z19_00550 [Trinickia soli]CAB3662439.1 hypothetical protein LMG24076_01514 [Trinickia soli]